VFAVTTFTPDMLPPEPVPNVTLVPVTAKLPVMFAVPKIFAPVPVTTNTFALPIAEIKTLPFAVGILTLLLPFAIVVVAAIPVNNAPLPI